MNLQMTSDNIEELSFVREFLYDSIISVLGPFLGIFVKFNLSILSGAKNMRKITNI